MRFHQAPRLRRRGPGENRAVHGHAEAGHLTPRGARRGVEERDLLISLPSVRSVLSLIEQADVTFVGVGSIGENSALMKDGFITPEENESLRRAGAVGEITGWAFDSQGRLIAGDMNDRVASAPLRQPTKRLMIGVAMGPSRRAPLRAALIGKLISGLVTDEATAEHLLRR